MLLITPCHHLCVTMETFCSHPLHSVLYAPALSPGRSSHVIVQDEFLGGFAAGSPATHNNCHSTHAALGLGNLCACSQTAWNIHKKKKDKQTHAHTDTHTHTPLFICGYLVKNPLKFQGSSEFRGDISSSVSPQGHSLQAAAVAAITALHLPGPFN